MKKINKTHKRKAPDYAEPLSHFPLPPCPLLIGGSNGVKVHGGVNQHPCTELRTWQHACVFTQFAHKASRVGLYLGRRGTFCSFWTLAVVSSNYLTVWLAVDFSRETGFLSIFHHPLHSFRPPPPHCNSFVGCNLGIDCLQLPHSFSVPPPPHPE